VGGENIAAGEVRQGNDTDGPALAGNTLLIEGVDIVAGGEIDDGQQPEWIAAVAASGAICLSTGLLPRFVGA